MMYPVVITWWVSQSEKLPAKDKLTQMCASRDTITSCLSGEHKLHPDVTGISSEQETIAENKKPLQQEQHTEQHLYLCFRDELVDLLAGVEGCHLHFGHAPLCPSCCLQVLVMLLQDLAEASEVQVLQTRETVTAFEPQLGYLPRLARKGITNSLDLLKTHKPKLLSNMRCLHKAPDCVHPRYCSSATGLCKSSSSNELLKTATERACFGPIPPGEGAH